MFYEGRHPLDSPYAKMVRAIGHLQALHETCRAWLEQRPYHRGPREFDPDTGWNVWRIRLPHPPPDQIGLVFGDYVGAARASLDHLVAAILRLEGREPSKSSAFPILTNADDWTRDRRKRMTKHVPERVVGAIKSLQPFHHPEDPRLHPLAILNAFANGDKHRLIHPAVIPMFRQETGFALYPGVEEIRFPDPSRPIEDGTPIFSVRTIPPAQYEMDAQVLFGLNIAFESDDLLEPLRDLNAPIRGVSEVMQRVLPLLF